MFCIKKKKKKNTIPLITTDLISNCKYCKKEKIYMQYVCMCAANL